MTLFTIVFDYILMGLLVCRDTFLVGDPSVYRTIEADGYAFKPKESKFVPLADRFHLSLLHAVCLSSSDTIIKWEYGADGEENEEVLIARDDPRVLEELRQCPDVDVYLPGSLRDLNSRLLPGWVFEDSWLDPSTNKTTSYHELCPHTPLLFFNHYWDSRHEAKDWPADKPIYVMPNIEMGQLKQNDYWRADVVLCKTRGCFDRATHWYEQQGNPRQTAVFYTRHTTSDIASYTRHILGDTNIRPKNFADVRFTHTAGSRYAFASFIDALSLNAV
ncbi:unnamed protein product [Phytophthora fragariaefolia]|uniref:Unnamed protein product n=1 Tax=Phytophthora fragariaefolia TaxID=1490495 RepID=A0A9W6YCZ5_9STRA|nr:unnamed protein product [Phytophthora fragariaefolia]